MVIVYGDNFLWSGIAGTGETPDLAYSDFVRSCGSDTRVLNGSIRITEWEHLPWRCQVGQMSLSQSHHQGGVLALLFHLHRPGICSGIGFPSFAPGIKMPANFTHIIDTN